MGDVDERGWGYVNIIELFQGVSFPNHFIFDGKKFLINRKKLFKVSKYIESFFFDPVSTFKQIKLNREIKKIGG